MVVLVMRRNPNNKTRVRLAEEWRPCPDFETHYEVSSFGNDLAIDNEARMSQLSQNAKGFLAFETEAVVQ